MPTEIFVLALAGLLQVIQYTLMAVPVNLQLGVAYTAGARDERQEPSGVPGRLYRALDNHFEGLILFSIAVVVVTLGGKSSGFTEACAWTYLVARVLYLPAYCAGIFMLRSLVWFVGFIATVLMLLVAVI